MSILADVMVVREGPDLYWEFADGSRRPAAIGDVLLWEIAGNIFNIRFDTAELLNMAKHK